MNEQTKPKQKGLPTMAIFALAVSCAPMIWYPKYLLIAFFGALSSNPSMLPVILVGYPLLLLGAFFVARSQAQDVAVATTAAIGPVLVLVVGCLVAGLPLSFAFSY